MGIGASLLGAGQSGLRQTQPEGSRRPAWSAARGSGVSSAELSAWSPRTVSGITVELGTQRWGHPWLPSRNVSPVW